MNTISSPSAPAHFLSETTLFFRPGLLWSSSGQNEQNEISLTCMYYLSLAKDACRREGDENQLIGDLYRFLYHGDQMISWWRIWPSTSKSTCVVSVWPRRMLLLGSVQAEDRSNWPPTPRDVHLFKLNCKLWLACVYLWKPFRCQEGRASMYFTRTAR